MEVLVYIVDDDVDSSFLLEKVLSELGYQYKSFQNSKSLFAEMEKSQVQPNLIMLDLCLDTENGLEVLTEIKSRFPNQLVVMITSYGEVESAVQAIKMGALDYLPKPLDYTKFSDLIKNTLPQYLSLDQNSLSGLGYIDGYFGLIGSSKEMLKVYNTIDSVRKSNANVFILGESGTGKELVAHAIHSSGNRSNFPFVEVNCGAIPSELMESELFGREKGAYTGAHARQIGKGEQAHKGTLFLDEICEMDLSLQVKLLRFLQERRFFRLGGTTEIEVDVRILAATNRDPLEEIRKGRFREDLYYRLNVIPIHIPPLRDHIFDLPLLINAFMKEFANEAGKEFAEIHPDALEMLMHYPWPGNVRELRNMIQRIVVLYEGPVILPSYIPDEFRSSMHYNISSSKIFGENRSAVNREENKGSNGFYRGTSGQLPSKEAVTRSGSVDLEEPNPERGLNLRAIEVEKIERALQQSSWDIIQAARELGISRATLYRKIKKYNIQKE